MGPAPLLSTRIESRNGVMRIALKGELDLSTVPILNDRLSLIHGEGVAAIMLDLRNLTFVDSSGLHACVAARDLARRKGRMLAVVGVSSKLRRVFELTETLSLIEGSDAIAVLRKFTEASAPRASSPQTSGVQAHA